MKHAREIRLTDAEIIRGRRRLTDVVINGDCMEYQGGSPVNGYRDVHFPRADGTRHIYAHRLAFALSHGGFAPAAKIVLHACDNRACVRADHLRLGTGKDNMDDMTSKGRRARKFTESDYEKVRSLRKGGMSLPQIARSTGISTSQVFRIIRKG